MERLHSMQQACTALSVFIFNYRHPYILCAASCEHLCPSALSTQELENVGAICSRRAAELYGLTVMAEGVQDVKDNITRFIVLSRLVDDACAHALRVSCLGSR